MNWMNDEWMVPKAKVEAPMAKEANTAQNKGKVAAQLTHNCDIMCFQWLWIGHIAS